MHPLEVISSSTGGCVPAGGGSSFAGGGGSTGGGVSAGGGSTSAGGGGSSGGGSGARGAGSGGGCGASSEASATMGSTAGLGLSCKCISTGATSFQKQYLPWSYTAVQGSSADR